MGTTHRTAADAAGEAAGPRWVRPAVGTALGTLVVAGLDAAIAGAAQRSGRLSDVSAGVPWYPYSLSRHVLAMAALALLTVAVAAVLTRRGAGLLAGLMIVAVAAGPMAVAGAPVTRSLLDDYGHPCWWWGPLVGAVQVALLATWTWWTASALRRLDPAPAPPPTSASASASASALAHGGSWPGWSASVASGGTFVTVAVVVLGVQALAGRGQVVEDLGVVAMLGWAALAGGLAAVIAGSSRWWTAPAGVSAAAAVLALMTAAYDRDGGWPGVAGWETITSPFVLSWTSTVAVCTAPVAAGLWRWMRSGRHAGAAPRPGLSPST